MGKVFKKSSDMIEQIRKPPIIMSIDNYIGLMIHTYGDVMKDTELSKALGVSRKTIWTKRKNLGFNTKTGKQNEQHN